MTSVVARERGAALTRLGGHLAVLVSIVLAVIVLSRDAGPNWLNGSTIVLGAAGGVLAVVAVNRLQLAAAWVVMLLAMAPALIGGLGLLYVPSLILLPIGRASAVDL